MKQEQRRRLYLWIGVAGLVACLLFSVYGWANPLETRYVFPSLSAYLALAITSLVFRPDSLAVIERGGFWVVAVVWLAGMAIGLDGIRDDEQAWQSLSPGVFMNMALLVVMAHFWYETHWALVASLVPLVASTGIGLIRFWDSPEYVGRLLQYEGYVLVIAAFTYLLSRGRDSMLTSQVEAERMRLLAFQDALTGLPNRRSVAERLPVLLVDELSPQPLSVISFDLDDFKLINDTYGHDAGDRLLHVVADIARAEVPANAMLGRWGGEEFLVLLPGAGLGSALEIAEALRLALVEYDDDGMKITASFGVSEVVAGTNVDDVLRTVDEQLYRAKRSGRNIVVAAKMAVREPPLDRRSRPRVRQAPVTAGNVAITSSL